MAVGNLDEARETLGDRPSDLVQSVPAGIERMSAAASVAEILFVVGDDVTARDLLKPYVTPSATILASALETRQKLQLAEYHYSLFDPGQAIAVATTILEDAERAKSPRDIGECRYYLARFNLRLNEHNRASEHCMKGIEEFHRAGQNGLIEEDALLWQTGRILRVRGTALWWMGRLSEATAVLYLAAWLLKKPKGSRMYLGDAFHALGRLLRSLGHERYSEAKAALELADKSYAGHDLKRARALTDLGRTLHNTGLQRMAEDKRQQALIQFQAGKTHLLEAFDISDRHYRVDETSTVWRRQKLDALVWLCWLYQEALDFVDTEAAGKAGAEAVELAAKMRGSPESVEALLAYGHFALTHGQREAAQEHLAEAAKQAMALDIQKLTMHAYLCMAELECATTRDVLRAQAHYDVAMSNRGDKLVGYLNTKAGRVKAAIGRLAQESDHFLFKAAKLFDSKLESLDENRLKILRSYAEAWAVKAAIRQEGSLAAAARKLNVAEGTIRGIQSRHDALVKKLGSWELDLE